MIRIFAILSLLALFAGIGCKRGNYEPERPNGVPAEAVWAGGPDGGAFIVCSFDKMAKAYECSVYNDYTGKVEATGHFRIGDSTEAEEDETLEYSGFDGKKIYLKNGAILEPTEDVDFPVN